MSKTRLSPDAWINAGLIALSETGPDALRAEPLARRLGTTKGSFYWHFSDVPAFHTALCATWLARAQSALSAELARTGPADKRLRQLGKRILADDTETAIRLWALANPAVVPTLRQCDADRLTYITLLLRELGLANADFARALQATLVGLPQITSGSSPRLATFDTLVDTVLAL